MIGINTDMRPEETSRGRSPTSRLAVHSKNYDDISPRKMTSERNIYQENYTEDEETREEDVEVRECSTLEPTVLYELIKARKWSAVVDRLRTERYAIEEAGTWIVERNVDGSVRWRLLPLHQVRIFATVCQVENLNKCKY